MIPIHRRVVVVVVVRPVISVRVCPLFTFFLFRPSGPPAKGAVTRRKWSFRRLRGFRPRFLFFFFLLLLSAAVGGGGDDSNSSAGGDDFTQSRNFRPRFFSFHFFSLLSAAGGGAWNSFAAFICSSPPPL
jgi:hypothetical protein